MEVEGNNALPFLDILIMRKGPTLAMKVCQELTHGGCYQHFKSNHSHHIKKGVVHGLISQPKVICQDQKDFDKEIKIVRMT
jgi:hypothetical protein